MRSVPLLERERELALIDGLIAEAADDAGRLVVIEGAAGLGKTRLLDHLAERAADSMRVLSASGSEFERDFPFGVVHQLFERALAEPGLRDRAFAGAAGGALPLFEHGEDEANAASGIAFRTLHALYWLTLNLAEDYPVALVLDDLQHCDEQSLRFLSYLSRRLEGVAVLLAVSWRSTDPGAAPALVAELAEAPGAARIRPQPLSEAGTEALIARRLGDGPDDSFGRACADATGGNPLLLGELLAALGEEGIEPDATQAAAVRRIGARAVSRTVFVRLSRLPDAAIEVARALAVLGDGAPVSTLARITGLDPAAIAVAAGELTRADLLRPGADLAFTHALVRDAVYADLPAAERQLRHTHAAARLREAGASRDQVAAQLLHTSPPGEPWAVETLLEAGRAALAAGGAQSATAYLRRALEEQLDEDERSRVLAELGAAEASHDAVASAGHLVEAFETTVDQQARVAVAILAGRAMASAFPERARELIRHALRETPEEMVEERAELRALELATWIWSPGDERWVDALVEHRRPPRGATVGDLMFAGIAAWDWSESGATAAECSELALAALAGGDLVELDSASAAMALWALVAAEHPRAPELAQSALERARDHGSLIAVTTFEAIRALLGIVHGDLPDAREASLIARSSYDLFDARDQNPKGHFYALLTAINLARGDLGAARRELEAGPEPWHSSSLGRTWLNAKTELLFHEGRYEEAIESADRYHELYPRISMPLQARWRSLKARSLAALDRPDEGLELVTGEINDARAFGAPGVLARSLRELAAITGELEPLEEAVEITRESPARLEHARALAALGSALRRNRKPTEAREPLRRGLELAAACGAEGLAEHVRTEIYASGARPRRDAVSGIESLTSSERRVAELAAGGATNRDIAQGLYVTPKTVELHLTNTYRKLGVRSRRELPAALA